MKLFRGGTLQLYWNVNSLVSVIDNRVCFRARSCKVQVDVEKIKKKIVIGQLMVLGSVNCALKNLPVFVLCQNVYCKSWFSYLWYYILDSETENYPEYPVDCTVQGLLSSRARRILEVSNTLVWDLRANNDEQAWRSGKAKEK